MFLAACREDAATDQETSANMSTASETQIEIEEEEASIESAESEESSIEEESVLEESEEESANESEKEAQDEPEELAIELNTISELLEDSPVIIYQTVDRIMDNNTVPIAFQIIKDNTVSIFEFDEAVAEGLDDFMYRSRHFEEDALGIE